MTYSPTEPQDSVEDRADGQAADVPTGVSHGDCATVQQRIIEQNVIALLLRKLSTCRVNPLRRLVVWTRTQLNVTLPHRDVRIVEGPIAREVRLELERLLDRTSCETALREKPQKIARAMSA